MCQMPSASNAHSSGTPPLPKHLFWAGGRPSIGKNASGWPTLSGLIYERVGSFSCPFPRFSFLVGRADHPLRFAKSQAYNGFMGKHVIRWSLDR